MEKTQPNEPQPIDNETAQAWRDTVISQIKVIRDEGLTNMFDKRKVFELAVSKDFSELANFIFCNTPSYSKFILTGDPELVVDLSI